MGRPTIIIVIILILACLWFGTAFTTCAPRGFASPGWGWGGPIFIGGGGGWDRGPSSPSSPPSSGRGSGGGLRGGGISGGRGGK